jgi:hypothetical protein
MKVRTIFLASTSLYLEVRLHHRWSTHAYEALHLVPTKKESSVTGTNLKPNMAHKLLQGSKHTLEIRPHNLTGILKLPTSFLFLAVSTEKILQP